ncbi:hypothetical protein KFL_016990010 [Klebsormidium nitens]|uniref:Uncharacterized protein n=1 Tax=Klebsormidium nitens TaxID=105231 RepID=A0A1Y1ISD6_KLENI|nr:hypothetical protein KFL_016990010 [Klebsormidium nitens]|eukprot:GAQ93603.1 hypothetical protein KFL_016990010 [Klebsormidium nitens]
MQREQKLKLRAEAGSLKGTSGGDEAVAYAAQHRGYSSLEKGREAQTRWEKARRGPVVGNGVCATAKRPVRAESVVKKTVKVVEVDLDESDDENGGVERERGTFVGADEGPRTGSKMVEKGVKFETAREGDAHAPATDRGRAARTISKKGRSGPIVELMREVVHRANVEAATEAVGAEEPEHGVEKTSSETSDAVHYQESESDDSGGVWVTPKAKKTALKRSVTS